MKSELHEILFVDNKFIRNRFRDDFFLKFHPLLFNQINEQITGDYEFKDKLYMVYYDIDKPICKTCGNPVHLISFNKGFKTYCSNKCIQKDVDIKNKVKETNVRKYGVDNPNKCSEFREKTKKTIKNKYGVDSVLQSKVVIDKIKKTNFDKYGVENPFQSDEIKEKIKQTNLIKYGTENIGSSKDVLIKRKECFIRKYGVDNPNKCDKIIEKRNKSIVSNYIKKYSKILNVNECDIESTINGDVKISNLCSKHNSFKISKQNLVNRIKYGIEIICTKCNPISDVPTIKENEIVDFIHSTNVAYLRNDRKFLKGKEIDIFIYTKKIGIEFNGLYWHSTSYKEKNYHKSKTDECEKKNIQLLQIFEDEWIYKKEIVKSIIKNKLGIHNNKIFARKCKIVEINSKTCKKFLDDNHIQGNINAKIKIGLYYCDELVSLMTFGKKRIAMGTKTFNDNEYEMLRFCNKLNTIVVGGASKLLNYFINTYNPKTILTFADRRYSNGNLYKQLGFEFIENTEPNYWYFKKSELIRYHRFKYKKDALVRDGYDKNKTEKQIMKERNFFSIYDCGNMKFLWKK